tara:strand:+ start:1183 stop:1683 length:501 start_codon:yes stop_codon:yes gene_type:complete
MAPTTIMMASAGISAGASLLAGQQAMAAGRYQQSIADRNAQVYNNKANQAIVMGEYNVKQFENRFASLQSATEMAFLKSGVVTSEGTPIEVMKNNIAEAELEKENIKYNAKIQSDDYKESAVLSRMEGDLAMYRARSARTSAILGAGSSLLGAYGQKRYIDTYGGF